MRPKSPLALGKQALDDVIIKALTWKDSSDELCRFKRGGGEEEYEEPALKGGFNCQLVV